MTRLLTPFTTVLIALISYRLYTVSIAGNRFVVYRAMEEDSSVQKSKFEDAQVGEYVQKIQYALSFFFWSLNTNTGI